MFGLQRNNNQEILNALENSGGFLGLKAEDSNEKKAK